MKIVLLGTRGIPANYGGFETFAEELSTRLVARGHEVTVYCRTNNVRAREPVFRGVKLKLLPTIPHKYFDTIFHTAISTLHLAWSRLFERFDLALYCNGANAIFTIVPRIFGVPTVLNVDGLERKRKKWNALARGWYRASERLSTWFPNAIVTDAAVIERYYAERYRTQSRFIAYGANVGKVTSHETLDRFGLLPDGYFLYVSRMEPENNALLVVKAFEQSKTDRRLVMVGDAPYAAEYIGRVRDTSDPRILFTGGVYGNGYHELQSHCFAYIHATEVGGTHPALIEAMGRGCPVLFLDTEENIEVAGAAGLAFPKSETSLAGLIDELTAMPDDQRVALGEKATQVVRERYDWEIITDQYEQLLSELAHGEM